jgi:hypothetical protein
MTPYRGKHRRTTADEETQHPEVAHPSTPVSEDAFAAHSDAGNGEADPPTGR